MERNDDLMNSSTTGNVGGFDAGTGSMGATGGLGATGGTATAGSTLADDASAGTASAKSTAADRFGQAKSAAADKLGALKEKASNLNLKEKASNLNATLADRLEAGANKLRQSGQGAATGEPAADGGAGSLALSDNQQLSNLGNKAADALQASATFLREGDLKQSIEQQVRTNPARTLLVAVGVGYVLGKALRGGNRS
jgi:hypothetical protein